MLFSSKIKVIVHDVSASGLAWLTALYARFNFEQPPEIFLTSCILALPVVMVVQGLIFNFFKLYRGQWRFASLQDLIDVVGAAVLGTLTIHTIVSFVSVFQHTPRSVFVLYPVFLIFFLGSSRLIFRMWKDRDLGFASIGSGERVLIVGAGSAGEAVLRETRRSREYAAVGFVDDNPHLFKSRIHGVPVLGTVDQIANLVFKRNIDLIIIAVPSAGSSEMQRIVDACGDSGKTFRILPKLLDNTDEEVRLESVREVSLDDLLGREKVELDWAAIRATLLSKTVLVSGGGGSVGIELCRQLADSGVGQLIVFDNSELNLYQAEREINLDYPELNSIFLLGDIRDATAIDYVFKKYRPSHVYHAAAYKHVPILENYVREAVSNNVLGTNILIEAAAEFQCETFVLISTDKAVKPSSIMGATKRIAELLCVHKNKEVSTNFITVRFGNVLGSTGSVVPLFRSQILSGGPVTVTHREAKRYFMTVSEASQLILEASAAGAGGEVFVLEMGEAVNIGFLAEQVIRLSGKIPEVDIQIEYIGLRPGEKLDEELFHVDEELMRTKHDKLLLATHAVDGADKVRPQLARLKELVSNYDEPEILRVMKELIPTLR
ncbi:MAG: nucleoside-diphosphate sugar epimerase/dehydratase [Rubritalea sp.]|uniref:nucleoside-diphosphate sugar epimerase/dehydratase n=1 Tax=Rubritalea sp. TaxID=2109375 RepID=UPI00324229BB